MNKKMLVSAIVGTVLGVVFVTGGTDAHASEMDGVWTPRTVDQIKADIAKAKDNQYTIVWGDTLSGISQATNLTVQKLADMNKIANVDLIYAGNTLVFDGNVVTAKNAQGETMAQTVVQPQDKNDATKPVGKQEMNQGDASKSTSSSKTKDSTMDMKENEKPADTMDSNNQGASASNNGTTGATGGTTGSTGKVEMPTQPSQPAEQSTKPVEQPTQPNQPVTPTQPSTSDNQGSGTTTPAIDPSTVSDQEPDPAMIGNSGKVFNSFAEADAYGENEIKDPNSKWYGYGYGAGNLLNKNHDPIDKYTVDFHEVGSLSPTNN